MASTAVDVLKAARDLIAKPNGWTQRAFARDAEGVKTPVAHIESVCFCIDGALVRVKATMAAYDHAANIVASLCPDGDIFDWNDARGRTQEEAVALLDAAIAKASAQ